MTTNNRPSPPLPKGITELCGQEIPHEQVEAGYRGMHHTAFITDQSSSDKRPVCGLYLTVWPNDDGDPDYRYVDELELAEIDALIPLLEVARLKLRDMSFSKSNAISDDTSKDQLEESCPIFGQRIINIRPITPAEMKREHWEDWNSGWACAVLELENGTKIYPSRDSEGNGPGCLYGICPKGSSIYVIPTIGIDDEESES